MPPVSVPTKRSFPAPRRVRIAPLQVDLDRCNISHSLCLDVAATGARCKRCVERYVLSVSWAGPISNLTGLFGSPAISPRDDGPTLNRSDLPVAVYGAYKQKQAPTWRPLWSSISYRKPSQCTENTCPPSVPREIGQRGLEGGNKTLRCGYARQVDGSAHG